MMNHIYNYKPQELTIAELAALDIDLNKLSTRRRFLIGTGGLLGAAALAGCGQSPPEPAQVDGPTRTVEHRLGTVEVPQNPQRVITLDPASLQSAVATGVIPIATADGDTEPLDSVADLRGVESVGVGSEPNLERIVELTPDLILGSDDFTSGIYERLSQIAPTVAFPRALGPYWKDIFLLYADALGRVDSARELLDEYELRVQGFGQRVREATGQPPHEMTVSLIRIRPDAIRVYLPDSFAGSVMAEVGLSRPEGQRETDDWSRWELSLEEIPNLAADHIIQFQTDFDTEVDTERVFSTPLWAGLEAVQQDRFHQATNGEWYLEGGAYYANFVLDDLERFLIEKEGSSRGDATA
ncbi:MAG: iron-siderophore ABC transporter substrate-binding protein [Chloroflexota bacterium]